MRRSKSQMAILYALVSAIACQLAGVSATPQQQARVYFERAKTLAKAGRTQQAASAFRRSLSLNPKDGEVWAEYAKIMEGGLNPAGAVEALSRAIEYQPGDWWTYNRRAEQYVALGRWQLAINDYTEAIKRTKGDDRAGLYIERGDLYATKHKYEEAIADYGQDIKLESDPARGYERRAATYKQLHSLDKALADTGTALKLEKDKGDLARLHKMRADIYSEQRKPDMAIFELTRAIEIEPHRTMYMAQRAKIYDQIGKHDLAQKDRAELTKRDKDYFGE